MKPSNPIRRRALLGLITCVLATLLTVPATQSAPNEKPLKVGINTWVGWMPWWIVKEKDLLKKHGVNAELKFFSAQGDSAQALAAGQIDACCLSTNDILSINKDGPSTTIVLMNDESSGADQIIARGINNGAELKGQKIAVELGGVSHFFLSQILKKNGLTESDVTLTNMTAADAGAAIVSKAINVGVTWEPFASKAVASGGKVLFSSKDTPNTIVDILGVRTPLITKRSADLQKLVDVWFAALAYVEKNPDDAFKIMAKASEVSVPEFKEMWAGVKMYSAADNKAAFGSAKKPGPFHATVADMAEFMVGQKLVEKTIAPAQMLDPRFIK
jgi:NitT/TauT family transport system substrate-binding protein